MKRQGSVLILVLLIFVVVLIGALYVFHSSTLHMYIARNKIISTQGFYTSEGKLNMCMYDDKYYNGQLHPIILAEFRQDVLHPKTSVLLARKDLDEDDSSKEVFVSFEMVNNRKCLKLSSSTINNNLVSNLSAKHTIVSEMFELGMPILHPDELNNKEQNDLLEYIGVLEKNITNDNIPRYINGINILDFDKIEIKTVEHRNLDILYFRKDQLVKTEKLTTTDKYKENEFFIILEDKFKKGINLQISYSNYPTPLYGILYIEGDLIINSEFIFNGILIINNGRIIVNTDFDPIINGIIISNGDEGWVVPERITVNYDSRLIYRYGTHLPDFLDYELLVMKKGK